MSCNKNGHRYVNGSAHLLVMFLSLQGKPPTKKATVLYKVNKTLPTPSRPDGEGAKHTHTHTKILFLH